jgi:hypothetical protein
MELKISPSYYIIIKLAGKAGAYLSGAPYETPLLR